MEPLSGLRVPDNNALLDGIDAAEDFDTVMWTGHNVCSSEITSMGFSGAGRPLLLVADASGVLTALNIPDKRLHRLCNVRIADTGLITKPRISCISTSGHGAIFGYGGSVFALDLASCTGEVQPLTLQSFLPAEVTCVDVSRWGAVLLAVSLSDGHIALRDTRCRRTAFILNYGTGRLNIHDGGMQLSPHTPSRSCRRPISTQVEPQSSPPALLQARPLTNSRASSPQRVTSPARIQTRIHLDARFSPTDPHILAACSSLPQDQVKIWDIRKMSQPLTQIACKGTLECNSPSTKPYNPRTTRCHPELLNLHSYPTDPSSSALSMAFSPDGSYFAVVLSSDIVCVYSAKKSFDLEGTAIITTRRHVMCSWVDNNRFIIGSFAPMALEQGRGFGLVDIRLFHTQTDRKLFYLSWISCPFIEGQSVFQVSSSSSFSVSSLHNTYAAACDASVCLFSEGLNIAEDSLNQSFELSEHSLPDQWYGENLCVMKKNFSIASVRKGAGKAGYEWSTLSMNNVGRLQQQYLETLHNTSGIGLSASYASQDRMRYSFFPTSFGNTQEFGKWSQQSIILKNTQGVHTPALHVQHSLQLSQDISPSHVQSNLTSPHGLLTNLCHQSPTQQVPRQNFRQSITSLLHDEDSDLSICFLGDEDR